MLGGETCASIYSIEPCISLRTEILSIISLTTTKTMTDVFHLLQLKRRLRLVWQPNNNLLRLLFF